MSSHLVLEILMSSYKEIVRTTGMIAIVQVIQIIFGALRNKIISVVLGAKGFGIWGLYSTYIEMVSAFSVLGLDQSGVREIAKNDDHVAVAKCIWIFKRALLYFSLSITLLSIIFSKNVSALLFGTKEYYVGVMVVSFAILCNGVSKGQLAILNGLRDIRGIAISQIIGSIVGSVACITLAYILGLNGIPIFLVAIGFTAVLSTWWFVRQTNIKPIRPSNEEAKNIFKKLIYLGLGYSAAGIIASVMTLLSRTYLAKNYDLTAVGIYQASWTISNLYIGTILSAMGVDFMPRIMKLINNSQKLNETVNEQIELGTLVASIGVLGIITFSPIILHMLYSTEFIIGVSIIRWQVLGVSLRVIAFPFSYLIMAHNKPFTYIIIQAIFWTGDYLLLIIFSSKFGFNGLGINYFAAYIVYLCLTYIACHKITGFKFSYLLKKIFLISSIFISAALYSAIYLEKYNYYVGSFLIICAGTWVYVYLKKYMDIDIIKKICSTK